MARARNIKPGFYKNEDLAECSIWARYIFPGLWMLADREGRMEDRPKRIKGELLPFDSQDAEPLLRELEERGFIIRYRINGGSYIQITKFLQHQTPHYSEKQSVIMPPVLQELNSDDEKENPVSSKKTVSMKRGSQPPESLFTDSLNPSSLNPSSPTPSVAVDTTLGTDIERERPKAPHAQRLPSDFALSPEWIEHAQGIRPEWNPLQVADVFAMFRDHWTAKSGKDATKLDWLATWRNWCRREKSFSRDGPSILTPGQRKAAVSKANIADWLAESADTNAINGEYEHERG